MINMHSKPVNFKEETIKNARKKMREGKKNRIKCYKRGGAVRNPGVCR